MTAPNRATKRAAAKAKTPPSKLNLDAQRAARREARGGHVEVTLGGEVFALPPELPLEAIEPLADLADLDELDDADSKGQAAQLRQTRLALAASLAALFCDEGLVAPRDEDDKVMGAPSEHAASCAWRRFAAHRPSLEDQLQLWEGLFEAYGVSLGEALARFGSAATTGAPSSTT